jgi:hypothetical protein
VDLAPFRSLLENGVLDNRPLHDKMDAVLGRVVYGGSVPGGVDQPWRCLTIRETLVMCAIRMQKLVASGPIRSSTVPRK